MTVWAIISLKTRRIYRQNQPVALAVAEAEPGDTVLLAPAAASFDQYPDFEKRGEAFIAAVKAAVGG